MAFNLGAFAGGLVSGGLKTYTTLKEQERLEGIEARDKERFEEEQRQIELRRQAEDITRKAAIPESGGEKVGTIAEAIPRSALYAGNEKGLTGRSEEEVAANEQAFVSTLKGLTPEQQALVLRGYGDTSNAGGREFEAKRRADTEGKYGIPEGLNTAVVREAPSGERFVVKPETDQEKIVARQKALAAASGNPLAIKAASDAEADLLSKQQIRQAITLGSKQILSAERIERDAAKVEDFNNWHSGLVRMSQENPMEAAKAMVVEYNTGSQHKDGRTARIVDVPRADTDTDLTAPLKQAIVFYDDKTDKQIGTPIPITSESVQEGIQQLAFQKWQSLPGNFKEGLAQKNKERELATSARLATAAERNAGANETSASASVTSAQAAASRAKADTDLVAAQLAAGGPKAEADYKKAQATQARAQANYYGALKTAADDERTTGQAATRAMKPFLEAYAKLSREDQLSDKGQALLDQAAAASITDAKSASQVLTALKRADKSGVDARWADIEKGMYSGGSSPADVAAARTSFFASEGYAPAAATQAVLSGKGPGGKPMTEADVDSFNAQFRNSKINKADLPWLKPAAADTTTPAAAAPAALKVAPVVGPGGLPAPNPQLAVPATATDTAGERTVIPAIKAANAAITDAGLQSIKDKIAKNQKLTGVERAQAVRAGLLPASAIPPKDKSAGPSAAELAAAAEDALVEKTNAELAKSKAAPAAPAGKSVAAQETELGYNLVVARDNYDKRKNATTKAQFEKAEKALADFRKANGIK